MNIFKKACLLFGSCFLIATISAFIDYPRVKYVNAVRGNKNITYTGEVFNGIYNMLGIDINKKAYFRH